MRYLHKAFYNQYFSRYDIVVPNAYFQGQVNEMDIAAIRKSGFLDEIEIKRTYADFKKDFGKTSIVWEKTKGRPRPIKMKKHTLIKSGNLPCNYFYFMMPMELAKKCEIPEYAGLFVYKILGKNRINIFEKIKPKRLHNKKLEQQVKYDMLKKIYYKYWKNEE